MLGVSRRERSFGVSERKFVAFLIDNEEHITLVHELIIPHANIIDVTGNVRCNRNDVGTDSGVSGPWRIEVITHQIVAEQTSCDEQDESKHNTHDGLHW